MKQWECLIDPDSNIRCAGGWVVELATGAVHEIGGSLALVLATQTNAAIYGARSFAASPMEFFIGGSGRNVNITAAPNRGCPQGYFQGHTPADFASMFFEGARLEVGTDGSVAMHDGTDVMATAPAGTVPTSPYLQCSAAAAAGGDGGGEYVVEMGTGTGTVVLSFDAFAVPDQFEVIYDGATVIDTGLRGEDGSYTPAAGGSPESVVCDGIGSGTANFNKTTAEPTTAIVRVTSPYQGTGWSFNLGCPAGGSPPHVPSTLTNEGSYELAATGYGEDTYNGGSPFTLTAKVEKAYVGTFPGILTVPNAGTLLTDSWTATDADHYTAVTDSNWTLVVNSDGTADISDGTDIVASRALGNAHDPQGIYEATTYGTATYNDEDTFSIQVILAQTNPVASWVWVEITESGPGVVESVAGPFRGPSVLASVDPVYRVPLAVTDGLGNCKQIQEGPIRWSRSTGGGGGATIVSLTAAEYDALDPKDADVFYDITDYEAD